MRVAGFADPCVGSWGNQLSRFSLQGQGEFPVGWGRKQVAAGLAARVAKTCLDSSVGEWSAKTRKDSWFVLSCFAFSGLDSCAHNPEVVGSSPASATKELLKSQDFRSFSFYTGQKVGSFIVSHCIRRA